ncbi:MAG: cation:dicarboxylate symporter family transporter [Planctomycetota bacterium]
MDRLLDMCRTMVNVWGDCSCAAVINKAEGG